MPKKKKKRTKHTKTPTRNTPQGKKPVGQLLTSPAAAWTQTAGMAAPRQALTLLERWPFAIDTGATTTIASLAADVGQTVPEAVEILLHMEGTGALTWDPGRNTYWRTPPTPDISAARPVQAGPRSGVRDTPHSWPHLKA